MDNIYQFNLPASIIVGCGAANMVGREAIRLGCRKAMIVTDKGVRKAGSASRAEASIIEAGLSAVVFDGVRPDPTVENVEDGLSIYRENGCDLIVAVGGGSSIDAAKGVAAMALNPGKISDYQGMGKIVKPCAPLIAIPTTAGTGSEATKFTVITETQKNVKMLIGSAFLVPRVALIDPLLSVSMPPELTAATGVDALTHAIEAYVSKKSNPLTDSLALSAIKLVCANLPLAWADGQNIVARANTMVGALKAGMAFSNSSVALVHGMSRPIGAYFHIPHGLSNAILLGHVMEFTMSGNYEKFADIAVAMGHDVRDIPADRAAAMAVEAVKKLLGQLKIPTLGQMNITSRQLNELAHRMALDAIASGSPANNPREASVDEIVELYMKCL